MWQAILDKFKKLDMLYVTPMGFNDDWFWLYSTVYEGRRSPAYVVSNDHMRDHRSSFPDLRAFMRWRSSQIVFFRFDKMTENSDDLTLKLFQPSKLIFADQIIIYALCFIFLVFCCLV